MKPITLPAVTLLSATLLIPSAAGAQESSYSVTSPDGRIELSVQAGNELTYRISLDGEALVSASAIVTKAIVAATADAKQIFGIVVFFITSFIS